MSVCTELTGGIERQVSSLLYVLCFQARIYDRNSMINLIFSKIFDCPLSFFQVCSPFATGPRQSDGTLYEFRTYFLKPSKTNEFLENFKKNVHLRTAHSELIGYWSVEFGGRTNKVFHIWKYGMKHTASVSCKWSSLGGLWSLALQSVWLYIHTG